MKAILFDTGPIISLSTNNLLSVLEDLKYKYGGKFLITPGVKKEAVDNPLMSRKFKFEAVQNMRFLEQKTIELYDHKGLQEKTFSLLKMANNIFSAHDNPIKLVHYAEMEVIAAAIMTESEAVVIDEFAMRMLIENPELVKKRFHSKLHTFITVNKDTMNKFTQEVKHVKVIRSIELITIAYELGFLNKFAPKDLKKGILLDSVLWGLKLNGCSITEKEIEIVKKVEIFK